MCLRIPPPQRLRWCYQAARTLRHSVIQIFEPASERGQAGIHELQQQTTSLLSFRQLEKKIFDAQLGFAMLARYGEDAPEQACDCRTADRAPLGQPAGIDPGERLPCHRCG